MSIIECGLCLDRYDSALRIPKNTGCGHMYCLLCLRQHKNASAVFKCPACQKRIVRQPDELETNYAIVSEASSTPVRPMSTFFCLTCNDEAKPTCSDHLIRDLVAYRKEKMKPLRRSVQEYAEVLEKTQDGVLDFDSVADVVATDIKVHTEWERQEAHNLLQRLSAPASGTLAQDAEAIRDASDYLQRQAQLGRGLQLLGLDKGVFNLKLPGLQGEGAAVSWVANVDLDAASEHREVLVAARVLFYLLHKHGYLRQVNNQKIAKPNTPHPAKGDGSSVQRQGQQGQGDAKVNASNRASELVENGELDLQKSGVGEAPPGQKVSEKAALLRSPVKVTRISGLLCDADPVFTSKIITKHSQYLEDLDIRQVKPEHIPLLGSLRVLTNLKVVGCLGRLQRLPPQTGCVLRSLYMGLPFQVQLGLWEAYATSVSNVVMRVRLHESVDVHLSIQKVAVKSPKLANLHLHRTVSDNHMDEECARQVAAIRSVLPAHVRVTCNSCKAGRAAQDCS